MANRISGFAYRLNAAGMRTGVTEILTQNLNDTRYLAYGYDNLNRLVTEYSDNTLNSNIDDSSPPRIFALQGEISV